MDETKDLLDRLAGSNDRESIVQWAADAHNEINRLRHEIESAHREVLAEAIAAEREACAKIVHDMQIKHASDACGWALDAIRARGTP